MRESKADVAAPDGPYSRPHTRQHTWHTGHRWGFLKQRREHAQRRKYIDACVVEAALAALHLDALASGVATVCSASGGSATRKVSRARTIDGTRTSFAQVYSVPGPQILRNTSKNRTPSSPMVCCCLFLCTLLLPVQQRASSATEHFLTLHSRTKSGPPLWHSVAAAELAWETD